VGVGGQPGPAVVGWEDREGGALGLGGVDGEDRILGLGDDLRSVELSGGVAVDGRTDVTEVVGQVTDAVLGAGLLATQRPQLGGGGSQVVVQAREVPIQH
jgi:hypothetical protein